MPEFDSVIPAGGSGTLTASVATKPTQRGRMVKSITVLTDAPDTPPLRLEIQMQVELPIEVLPSHRIYLQAKTADGDTEQLVLRRSDGQPLELFDPVSRVGAWVEFSMEPVERPGRLDNGIDLRPGDVVLSAAVKDEVEAVSRSGNLQLRTNHAQMPVLEIPVTLRVRPMVELRPAEIRLVDQTTRPGTSSTIVRIVHNSGARFRIRGVEIRDADLVQAGPATDGARSAHNIWVRIAPVADGVVREYPARTDVTVHLEDAGRESVTLPVVVAAP